MEVEAAFDLPYDVQAQDPIQALRSALEAAPDKEIVREFAPGDPFGRVDAVLIRSASLGKALRDRRIYRPVLNAQGVQVGWALQDIVEEEVQL